MRERIKKKHAQYAIENTVPYIECNLYRTSRRFLYFLFLHKSLNHIVDDAFFRVVKTPLLICIFHLCCSFFPLDFAFALSESVLLLYRIFIFCVGILVMVHRSNAHFSFFRKHILQFFPNKTKQKTTQWNKHIFWIMENAKVFTPEDWMYQKDVRNKYPKEKRQFFFLRIEHVFLLTNNKRRQNVHTFSSVFFFVIVSATLNNRIINFHRTNQSVSTAVQIAHFVRGFFFCCKCICVCVGPIFFIFRSILMLCLFELNLSTEKLLRLHKND